MMAIDYYQILQIPPSADLADIKTAYRRLAHLYHPDKNTTDKNACAYFELIKEAYETLSNTVTKEKYLQHRWLAKANLQEFELPQKTPEQSLIAALAICDKINKMDVYRTYMAGAKEHIQFLLNPDNITLLNEFDEAAINDAIVRELLYTTSILPGKDQIEIIQMLQTINSTYLPTLKTKEEELNGKVFWENWKPAFIILIVILLCILIWGTSLKY